MANDSFEFSPEQSDILRRLARLMKYAGILFIFLGVTIGTLCGFTIVKYPLRGFVYLLMMLMAVSFGVWTNSVSYSFKVTVESTGKNIDLLIEAFKTMKRVYWLQFIWLLIMTLLSIVVLIMSTLSGYQLI